jgi:hypothetical protein
MDETQQLESLRSKVVADLKPLLVSSDMLPEQKFTLLLNAAMTSGATEDFAAAKEVASQIEDDGSRANALMDLLGAIDLQLGDIVEDAEPVEQPHQEGESTEGQ